MTIDKICVCGAGTMGSGIAQALAQAGFNITLYELNPAVLQKAEQQISKSLASLVAKEKITGEAGKQIFSRIQFTSELSACKADLIIEAIIESYDAKIALFDQLAGVNDENCIFATNTSSLSIGRIQAGLKMPRPVFGMHFFNPATIMKLVEVVTTNGHQTDMQEKLISLVKKTGKTPVRCRDSPGFIVNRVARPFYIEALRLAEESGAKIEVIDELMESAGFKMGPFRLMDLIGNDVNYAVSCSVYEQLSKPERLKPSIIQEQKVKAGKLGRKTGEGYYKY
jgi:3-hydroxybutyryl-CoA dehydrogenase